MLSSLKGITILCRASKPVRFLSAAPAIAVPLIAELRKSTGSSIQKCKEALEQTQGDMKRAIEFLRKRGENINSRSIGSPTIGSRISASRSDDARKVVITRTTSQTDFASESEVFVKFSESVNRSVCMLPTTEMRHIPPTLELCGEISAQIHGKTLSDVVSELSSLLSEPVNLSNVDVVEGDIVSLYVHGKSPYSSNVGCIACAVGFGLRNNKLLTIEQKRSLSSLCDCVARQVLATNPRYVKSSHIPDAEIEREKELLRSRIKNPAAFEKAFAGHLRKVQSENCLMEMEWIIPMSTWSVPEGSTVGAVMDAVCQQIGLDPNVLTVDKFIIRK